MPEQAPATLARIKEVERPFAFSPCKPVAAVGTAACAFLSIPYGVYGAGHYSGTLLYAVKGRLGLYLALLVPVGKASTDTAALLAQEEALARKLFERVPFAHQ